MATITSCELKEENIVLHLQLLRDCVLQRLKLRMACQLKDSRWSHLKMGVWPAWRSEVQSAQKCGEPDCAGTKQSRTGNRPPTILRESCCLERAGAWRSLRSASYLHDYRESKGSPLVHKA